MRILSKLKQKIPNKDVIFVKINALKKLVKRHKRLSLLAFIIIIIFTWRVINLQSIDERDFSVNSRVSVISIGELSNNSSSLNFTGEVESISQAELKSEITGKVSRIFADLGKKVFVGQILVTLDASELNAQLLEAQANLDAAKGGSDNALIQLENAEKILDQTKIEAINTAQTAFDESIDALVTHADIQLKYFNVNFSGSNRIAEIKEKILYDIYKEKYLYRTQAFHFINLDNHITTQLNQIKISQNTEDIKEILKDIKEILSSIKSLLDATKVELNDTNATDIDKSLIETERITINTQISTILGQEQAIIVAENNVINTESQLNLGITSSQVKQAEAGVAFIKAQLAKTVIRSPITGTVSYFSPQIRPGNLVNPGQMIVSVVNTKGFLVRAFIDTKNREFIEEKSKVTINNNISGIISVIAPSVNLDTKKIEIIIEVTDQNPKLSAGEFVTITIPIKKGADTANNILIPLSSVRIRPDASFVFTINEDNEVMEQEVELGRVIGSSVEIIGGLNKNTKIISSIRGLKAGQKVELIE